MFAVCSAMIVGHGRNGDIECAENMYHAIRGVLAMSCELLCGGARSVQSLEMMR